MTDPEPKDIRVDVEDILDEPLIDENGNLTLSRTDKQEEIDKDIDTEGTVLEVAQHKIETDPHPIVNDPNQLVSVNLRQGSPVQRAIGNPIANDALVDSIRNEDPTTTLLNRVMEEIAEEAAFIKAWRNENWDAEKDLSEATNKRIQMLRQLVETIVHREKLKQSKNVGKIDFHGENFQEVLKYFLKTIQGTFKKVGIPEQYGKIFFAQLAKDFDGFEKKAEKIYYGKKK